MNQLNRLRQYSRIVVDSSDFSRLEQYSAEEATTNPSLLLKLLQQPQYQSWVEQCLKTMPTDLDRHACYDWLLLQLAQQLLAVVPGRVSVEIDARLSHDAAASFKRAEQLLALAQRCHLPPQRLLIKLASTWAGIEAARQLQQRGIGCNLTLMFSMVQAEAAACAQAQVISPFVGRIYDWHRDHGLALEPDPGVALVRAIYRRFSACGASTQVMAASFRRIEHIQALAGCDLLTIAPQWLDALLNTHAELPRALAPRGSTATESLAAIGHAEFTRALAQDPCASELLEQGIELFVRDTEAVEGLLGRH